MSHDIPSSAPRRVAALSAVVVLAVTAAVVGAAELRERSRAAQQLQQAEARVDLAADLQQRHAQIRASARDAATALRSTQLATAELLTGSDRAPAAVRAELTGLTSALLDHADSLTVVATTAHPTPSPALPDDQATPVLADASELDVVALALARDLRGAVTRIDATTGAAERLRESMHAYTVSADALPEDDDPDVIAAAWEDERDRLMQLQDALEALRSVAPLGPLTDAHLQVTAVLDTVALEAVETLGAGDVDAYNAAVEEQLSDEAIDALVADLTAALDDALRAALAPLEDLEERSLGLVRFTDTRASMAAPRG